MCKYVWTGLCFILYTLFAQSVYAQTYTLNVGERYTLPYPTPPAGYVDHLGAGRCTNVSDCIGVSGLQVYVYNYFSGTATVAIDYNYTYTGSDKRTHVGNSTAYYSIKCQPTTVSLNKTELTMDVGDELDLSYSTDPYGMEPYVNWRTSNKNVVELDYSSKESIEWEKTMTIYAAAEGTCTITLQCNTGKPSPKCNITVVDSKWVKADVPSGTVKRGRLVTLTSSKAGATIYYTTDGTEPSKQSTKYTQPIPINESMTLKAKAYLGNEESKTTTREYKVVNYEEGDVFTYTTVEGVKLQMMAYIKKWALSDPDMMLQVGIGEEGHPAVDKNYNGHITLPSSIDGLSVGRIAQYAFDGCKLSSITLKRKYFEIHSYAFRRCENLVEIAIPCNYELSSYAFQGCTSLRVVNFSDGMHYGYNLSSNTFYGCNSINRVYIENANAIAVKTDVFPESVYKSAKLFVPDSKISSFKSANGWNKFTNIESIGTTKETQVQLTSSLLGEFAVVAGTKVILSSPNVADADIYYTLDGTTPTKSSTKYTSTGVGINRNCVLKAIAYKNGYEDSNILISGIYDIRKTNYPMKRDLKQISAGIYHSMFVKTDRTLWVCGSNTYGALGDGTTTNRANPVKTMNGVAFVSPGGSFSLIVRTDGSLWACGYNYYGELGNGTTTDQATPVKIMDDVAYVSAGEDHSLIVKNDGSLWACGWNVGQLGDGTTDNCQTPKKIMDGVASCSAGYRHSLIVKTDGSLWVCGSNAYGQLGDGTTTTHKTPKKIMENVASVSAGAYHSLIIKTDGSLWACGLNESGQLGDGTNEDVTTPKKIMENVTSASAGEFYSLIVKGDGSLWGCGSNVYGQLGDGTTTDHATPIRIMDGVVSASAGGYHSLIVKTDGSPWAFGSNSSGRLGDGTEWSSATPIKVTGLPEKHKVVMSATGYATFYDSQSAFSLPNGLSAQVVSGVSDSKITYEKLTGNVVPKNVAVMLINNAQQAGTYTLTASESTTTYSGTNLLHGSDEATTTTGDGYHYKLSYGKTGTTWNDVFGWYWGAQDGVPFQIDGHKAWLVVPNGSTRAAGFTINGDATEIIDIESGNEAHDVYYDMQGRRISTPTRSGLYIKNGKKVIIK